MTTRMISVVPYDADWPARYEEEAIRLQHTIAPVVRAIHHIGSTAVPGLAAKPVIDILLEVTSLTALDDYNAAMTALGYQPRGENGIAGRRYFIKGAHNRSHHLHAFASGSEHITRHLALRDYLHRHDDIARQYARVKYAAADACGNDAARYGQLKHDFIQRHEALAMAAEALSAGQRASG